VTAGNLKGIAAEWGFDSKSVQELLEKKVYVMQFD